MKTGHSLGGVKHSQTAAAVAAAATLSCTDCHTAPGNLRSRCCWRRGHDTEASKGAGPCQPHGAEVSESGWGIGSDDVHCSEKSAAAAAGETRMSHEMRSTEGQMRSA